MMRTELAPADGSSTEPFLDQVRDRPPVLRQRQCTVSDADDAYDLLVDVWRGDDGDWAFQVDGN